MDVPLVLGSSQKNSCPYGCGTGAGVPHKQIHLVTLMGSSLVTLMGSSLVTLMGSSSGVLTGDLNGVCGFHRQLNVPMDA